MEDIGVYIKVKSDLFNIEVPMERRITYLRGDSGVGKSTMVDFIMLSKDDDSIEVSYPKGYSIDILNSLSSTLDIESKHNAILIVDDNVASEGVDFSNAVVNYLVKNNLYLLIINRVDVNLSKGVGHKSFDFSVRSILHVKKDGVNHMVTCFIDDIQAQENRSGLYDCILCEDTYGMSSFCKFHCTRDVFIDDRKNKTKDNIMSILANISKEYKSIYVFVDMATFGKYVSDFIAFCNECTSGIATDFCYESFEYLILCSNLFGNLYSSFSKERINNYSTWEGFYEYALEELSREALGFKYSHGKELPYCLRINCSNCPRGHKGFCSKIVNGDKLSILFKDTEFEYVIKMLRG